MLIHEVVIKTYIYIQRILTGSVRLFITQHNVLRLYMEFVMQRHLKFIYVMYGVQLHHSDRGILNSGPLFYTFTDDFQSNPLFQYADVHLDQTGTSYTMHFSI